MAGMLPASVYGLRVPAGLHPIPASEGFPATFRITMAAIDPTAESQEVEGQKVPRATLKLIRETDGDDDEDDEDYDEHDFERIKAGLIGAGVLDDDDEDMSEDDEDEDDSEDEKNGGPSDPAKSKKAKVEALMKKLKEDDDEMDVDDLTNGVNGTKSKGKARALDDEEISSDEDDDEGEVEEFVLCTLDPEKNYQQPLDITVGENEMVYFQVIGTHDIYLTGNYVLPPDDMGMDMDEDEDEDDDEYDLSPGEDGIYGESESESEEDELDGLQDPRVTEVDSEDEQAPKLVKADSKKGKNKRPAESEEDEATTLDEMISKNKNAKATAPVTNGEDKLSKKQAKKLKKNDGQAVATAQEPAKKETPGSDKKKVQFSKNLEMGPTGSPNVEEAKKEESKKEVPKTGPRVVGGVTVDDKKIGKGKAAKKGDRIEMRYIGKLKNGKQFDANKKGKPFSFKLGVGEVIKGWDIGVAGITAGGERRLTIPAKLAYGNKALPDIPANSDLVFDIKCISVS